MVPRSLKTRGRHLRAKQIKEFATAVILQWVLREKVCCFSKICHLFSLMSGLSPISEISNHSFKSPAVLFYTKINRRIICPWYVCYERPVYNISNIIRLTCFCRLNMYVCEEMLERALQPLCMCVFVLYTFLGM